MNKFNQGQQRAIDSKGNLLVSASAGTGKTTVMIQRIYQMIARGEADVSQLLVVTFTNLAAAEMKQRLAAKLSENAQDPVIADKLERLDSASISTIHSFCSDMLRNYFYVVDIDPAFSVLDDISVTALKKEAIDKVLADYGNDDIVFNRLYGIFASKRREDKFRQAVYSLYEFACTQEDFYKWYSEKRANYDNITADGVLASAVNDSIKSNSLYFAGQFEELAEEFFALGMAKQAEICLKNRQSVTLNSDSLEVNLKLADNVTIDALRAAKKAPENTDEDVYNDLLARSKNVIDKCREFLKGFAPFSGKDWDTIVEQTRSSVQYTDKLVEVLGKFTEQYAQLKKRLGAIDFNDMERLALEVLKDEQALQQLKNKYRFIFVDEYQDTNRVQEAIVRKLCGTGNFFAVGDVKQSIYGFRGCEPEIFVDKYNDYRKDGTLGSTVELNVNYRSGKNILDFVNTVCRRNITERFGKVDYEKEAMLIGSEEAEEGSVEVIVAESRHSEKRAAEGIYDITSDIADQSDDEEENLIIADKILSLVGSTVKCGEKTVTIGYGDIAVLSPSMTEKALSLYNCLVRHNIPVVAGFKTEGFLNKEVRDIINFLRVVDNICDDSCLVGVCMSPFGNLTEEEMAQIAVNCKGTEESFYEKIASYISSRQNKTAEKADKLLTFIEKIRFFSYSATVDEVILELMRNTDWELYIGGLPNGSLRLRKLYEFVDSLKGSFYAQSVSKFVQYIDEAEDIRSEQNVSEANAVRMMTMHASKGLEFPVVILANCERQFRPDSPTLVTNAEVGMCVSMYDFDNMVSSETLGTVATGMYNALKLREESMRLLYVAMTRAKNRLIIVSRYNKSIFASRAPSEATSQMEWIISALREKYGEDFKDGMSADGITYIHGNYRSEESVKDEGLLLCAQDDDLQGALERLGYVYPYAEATTMPGKMASSSLDRLYFDDSGEDYSVPSLAEEQRKLTGTAYHMLYQFIDLGGSDIKEKLEQLVALGRIDGVTASQIDTQLIMRTLSDKKFRKLFEGGRIYREQPFMLNVNGREIGLNSDETIVLQGIIDLLAIFDGYANVVDFKYTKNFSNIEKNYKSQLESYRLAVRKITGIQDVRCYVLSIADDKLVSFQ